MRLIDVEHLGRERVIGCWELDGVLIDPGPTSSLDNLIAELGGAPPRALLTHIHLDHAGATGTMVRRWPELPVYVHEIGARHLADPTKLLASAARLYGDQMERLWGEVAPVPEANLNPLSGGEEVLGFEVAYTPGHASHHVSYLHRERPRFRRRHGGRPDPAERLRAAPDPAAGHRPRPLGPIDRADPRLGAGEPRHHHFGAVEEPEAHLEVVRERLREQARLAAS